MTDTKEVQINDSRLEQAIVYSTQKIAQNPNSVDLKKLERNIEWATNLKDKIEDYKKIYSDGSLRKAHEEDDIAEFFYLFNRGTVNEFPDLDSVTFHIRKLNHKQRISSNETSCIYLDRLVGDAELFKYIDESVLDNDYISELKSRATEVVNKAVKIGQEIIDQHNGKPSVIEYAIAEFKRGQEIVDLLDQYHEVLTDALKLAQGIKEYIISDKNKD